LFTRRIIPPSIKKRRRTRGYLEDKKEAQYGVNRVPKEISKREGPAVRERGPETNQQKNDRQVQKTHKHPDEEKRKIRDVVYRGRSLGVGFR